MLEQYNEKRNFSATPEPAADTLIYPHTAPIFVIPEHNAKRLHWDFRLEHNGVLISFAVPKEPVAEATRLAIHVEDHPVTYANFEGEIPAGNYGAGTVKIWDKGTFEPFSDFDLALSKEPEGRALFKFRLHGHRLTGVWSLSNSVKNSKEQFFLRKLSN